MTISNSSLPIWEIHDAIVDALRTHASFVLIAPTGSGKTTQVAQMLLDAGLVGEKKIVVLQPRRVAARTVAARVAWERKSPLGAEVGYQVRFDDQTSLGTRICFVTEGILLRWLQDDPALSEVGVVLFDEFHERNLLSDVALAIVKQMQRTTRPDLKLGVMSATLEADPVAKYLDGCPVLISEGRAFPVEICYNTQHDERPVTEQAADAVEKIVNSGEPGDILIFMAGMAEINATIAACRAIRAQERLALIPLHGDLQPEEQDRAFAPSPLRKVIVSTNVAETSVTIDGVRHVVDGGQARVARYDAERGINTLFIEPISRASADQRAGRAGRTAPGVCWRLWTESAHLNLPARNTPEIQRADLAETVLLLHSLGIRDAAHFDWLEKPNSQAVERAEDLLRTLGALECGECSAHLSDITPVGRQMLRLPMSPRYSRMMVEAIRHECIPAAALCAALVSGRDLLVRLGRDDKHIAEARELFEASADSDFYTLMRAYQFAVNSNFNVDSCRRYGVHAQIGRQVRETFEQILKIAQAQGKNTRSSEPSNTQQSGNPPGDPLLKCLAAGFIDQLCVRRDQGTLECELTEGRTGTLMRESVVQNASLFVAANIREVSGRTGNLTLLGLATAVKREWVEELAPSQMSTRVEHLYDRTNKRVSAIKLIRFRDLVIHHEYQKEIDPVESARCLASAWQRDYFELPLFNHEVKQWIARVNLVNAAMPELEFPAMDETGIIQCLTRAFHGLTLAKEAQAASLKEAFGAQLGKERSDWLNELAPLTVPWVNEKKIKLLYAEETEPGKVVPPELQVKLSDALKLEEHPRVCENRVPVKLWLCAPDGKRIESTLDWASFKANSYPKIRPVLQKKYPGSTWL